MKKKKEQNKYNVSELPKINSIVNNKFFFLIVIFFFLVSFFCCIPFNKNVGIAGHYIFSYNDILIEEMFLNITNDLSYFKYEHNDFNVETTNINYKWNLALSFVNNDDYPNMVVSNYSLQICNDKWESYWSYYYLNGCFYSKIRYPEYGDKQISFKKTS